MNLREKRKFVRELIKNVEAGIMERLVDTPDSWDGHELRRYIADKFETSDYGLCSKHPRLTAPSATARQRRREYENDVIVRNL